MPADSSRTFCRFIRDGRRRSENTHTHARTLLLSSIIHPTTSIIHHPSATIQHPSSIRHRTSSTLHRVQFVSIKSLTSHCVDSGPISEGRRARCWQKILTTPQQPGRACKKLLAKRPRVVTEAELFETPRQTVPPGGRMEWVGTAKAIQLLLAQESA